MPTYRFLEAELLVWPTTPKCKPKSLVIAGLQLMQRTVCFFLPAVKQELFLSWMKSGHHGSSGKGVLKELAGEADCLKYFCVLSSKQWFLDHSPVFLCPAGLIMHKPSVLSPVACAVQEDDWSSSCVKGTLLNLE